MPKVDVDVVRSNRSEGSEIGASSVDPSWYSESPRSMAFHENNRDHRGRKQQTLEIHEEEDTVSQFSEEDLVTKEVEFSKNDRLAQRIERILEMKIVQFFYVVLTMMYCWKYVVDEMVRTNQLEKAETSAIAMNTTWLLSTGIPLAVFTFFEWYVRVHAQAGPPFLYSSIKRFLIPLFHKFETCVLFALSMRGLLGIYLVISQVYQLQPMKFLIVSDRLTVTLMVFFRGVRIWAITYKVSVQATIQQKRERLSEKVWMPEHLIERHKYHQRRTVRLQKALELPVVQIGIFFVVLIHCLLYSWTRRKDGPLAKAYGVTRFSGYTILSFFLFEFFTRAVAQGGEQFFMPRLHQVELVFLIVGTIMLAYATYYSNAIRENKTQFEPTGSAIVVVLLAHRFMRFIGIKYKVSASKWDANSVVDAQANAIVRDKVGDILEVPPQNVQVRFPMVGQSTSFEVHVRKAKLKPEREWNLKAESDKAPQVFKCTGLIVHCHAGHVVLSGDETSAWKEGEWFALDRDPNATVDREFAKKVTRIEVRSVGELLEEQTWIRWQGDIMADGGPYYMFRGRLPLHLPLCVMGGFIEELHIKARFKARQSGKDPSKLLVKNMLLLIGPGEGLAEAGGMAKETSYWTHHNVLEAKSRLVDIICRRLSAPAEPEKSENSAEEVKQGGEGLEGQDAESPASKGNPRKVSLVAKMKLALQRRMEKYREAAKSVGEMSLRDVDVDIRNILVQYEDTHGLLGQGHVSLGMKVGQVIVERRHSRFLKCEAMRLGVFAETGNRRSSTDDGNSGTECDSSPADSTPRRASDMWRSRLGELLENDPKKAAEALKRLNSAERIRLWAFEAMDRRRNIYERILFTDAKQHEQSESWPETRLIFSLLKVCLHGGPQSSWVDLARHAVGSDENAQTPFLAGPKESRMSEAGSRIGPSDSFTHSISHQVAQTWNTFTKFGKDKKADENLNNQKAGWRWSVDFLPVRVSVDAQQFRSIQNIDACWKAWFTYDNAFRWRPELRMEEVKEMLRTGACGKEEHRTTARLWWLYAFYRILAQKQRRPQAPWLDLMWRSNNFRRYSTLLSEVALRTGNEPLDKKMQHWEHEWANELQVRLPLMDIIQIRRRALGLAARSNAIKKKEAKSRKSKTEAIKHTIISYRGHHDMSQKENYSRQALEFQEKHSGVGVAVMRSISHLKERTEEIVEDKLASAAEASVSVGLAMEHRLTIARDTALNSLSPRIESELGGDSGSQPNSARLDPVAMVSGQWRAFLPVIEVRLLQYAPRPRPVLICWKVNNINVDWSVNVQDATREGQHSSRDNPSDASQGDKTEDNGCFKAVVAVDGFGMTCEGAKLLAFGCNKHILTVTRLLTLPEPTQGMDAGRHVGDQLAFAARVLIAGGERNRCEMHLADMRIMIPEPLILTLLRFFKEDNDVARIQTNWTATKQGRHSSSKGNRASNQGNQSHRESSRASARGSTHQKSVAKRFGPRKVYDEVSGTLNVASGRIGLMKARLAVQLEEEALPDEDASGGTKYLDTLQSVRERRANRKARFGRQWFFEQVAIRGADFADWDVDFTFGGVHVMQVGDYLGSDRLALIEDYKLYPFSGSGARGIDNKMSTGSQFPVHGINMKVRGFLNRPILPWESSSWRVEESLADGQIFNAATQKLVALEKLDAALNSRKGKALSILLPPLPVETPPTGLQRSRSWAPGFADCGITEAFKEPDDLIPVPQMVEPEVSSGPFEGHEPLIRSQARTAPKGRAGPTCEITWHVVANKELRDWVDRQSARWRLEVARRRGAKMSCIRL